MNQDHDEAEQYRLLGEYFKKEHREKKKRADRFYMSLLFIVCLVCTLLSGIVTGVISQHTEVLDNWVFLGSFAGFYGSLVATILVVLDSKTKQSKEENDNG